VKTHFDRTLLDTSSESRAWILGLTYVGIIVVIGLSGMHLLQKPSQKVIAETSSQEPQTSIEAPITTIPKRPPIVITEKPAEPTVPTNDTPDITTPIAPAFTSTIDPQPESIPQSPQKTNPPNNSILPKLETRFAPPPPIQADSFFNNTLVRIYRQKHPDDPMTNRELTETMGDHYKVRGTFIAYAEKFPDWAQHYNMIKKEKGGE
jgi:hypothetical protein